MAEHAPEREALRSLIANEVIKNKHDGTPYSGGPDWIFDFRAVLLKPKEHNMLIDALWGKLKHRDNFQIGGIESAAIPLVTGLLRKAHEEGKQVNGFYIRKSRKKSGLFKPIEGELNDDPIVLVDDLMNYSNSVTKQLKVLEAEGRSIDEVLVIVRFRPVEFYEHLLERDVTITNLFTLDDFDLVLGSGDEPNWNPYPTRILYEGKDAGLQHVTAKSTPILDEDGIYFGTSGGTFLKLNKETGSIVWEMRIGAHPNGKGISSAPTLWRDLVLFGAYDGQLYALDRETGEAKWIFNDCEWIGSSPTVAEDLNLVFVGLEHGLPGQRGSIIALKVETGERVWEYRMPALTHASPLYIAETQQVFIGGNEGVQRCFNARTGELEWQFQTEGGAAYRYLSGFSPGDIKQAPIHDAETDTIAFSSMDGWLYVLNRANGTLKYRLPSEKYEATYRAGIYARPLVLDEKLYVCGLDKKVRCHDKQDGKLLWEYETAGRLFGSPAVVDGSVFVGSNDGRLYELDDETGHCRSKTQFTERVTNTPVHDAANNRLYVLTHADQLYELTLT